ncbi:MAG: hypothetical protein SGILL_003438 [Bacillariaceae sp.]
MILCQSAEVYSERLDISSDEVIRDQEPGKWFLQLYSSQQIMSVVHLSLIDQIVEQDEKSRAFRELTFFTNGVSDLYSKRDDLADDDSTESHISEYMCVSEFADKFEMSQDRNFALAAYRALRHGGPSPSISSDDFTNALEALQFIEINSFLVAGVSNEGENSDSKLLRSIKTILLPVPGDNQHFYYTSDAISRDAIGSRDHQTLDDSNDSASSSSSADEVETNEEIEEDLAHPRLSYSSVETSDYYDNIEPPIFVKFRLGDEVASIDDLNSISTSCMLKVTVSVYKSDVHPEILSIGSTWSHRAFSAEISTLLKSYVAEQTLERMQGADDMLSEENFRLVKKCMARIQSVKSLSIEVYFYISHRGTMMPAAAPAGGETEAREGFAVLDEKLRSHDSLVLIPLQENQYFVSGIREDNRENVRFWCLISFENGNGVVSVQLYHPEGPPAAVDAMSKIHEVLSSCIHVTNQQLLLRRYVQCS